MFGGGTNKVEKILAELIFFLYLCSIKNPANEKIYFNGFDSYMHML